MTEDEEFEFRMRLEQEQVAQSSAQPQQQAASQPQDMPVSPVAQAPQSTVQAPPHMAGRFGSTLPRLPENAGQELMKDTGNLIAGGVRGIGSIGATFAAPYGVIKDLIAGKGLTLESNRQNRADMDAYLKDKGANPDSMAYQGGKLAAEVAATYPVGGFLANGVRLLPAAAKIEPLAQSIASGGFRVGGMTGAKALPVRAAGGAITGGASAGLVNPEDAGMGAVVGGAIPGTVSVAGNTARGVGRALRGGEITPEVVDLANKAKNVYGIDVPADRIVDSKPLNALGASLEYMPFSGRTASLDKVQKQYNTAISRTFGQNSDNVTMALRKAQDDLGGKFDDVLKNNTVKMDQAFTDELAEQVKRASSELEQGQANIITKQIDEIMAKVNNGQIDGQAAYNIKKTLDRIGQRNSPEAWYANDLKKSLMGVLNRSLKPEDAAAFAKVRQQYGTMLDLKKLAQNGADGDISIARVANMKNIGNPELQDLADIGAQFLKSRESPHGAMQRIMLGGLGAAGAGSGVVSPLLFGGAMAAGRGANSALNSNTLRGLLMSQPKQGAGLLTHGAERANKVLPLLAPQLVNDQ